MDAAVISAVTKKILSRAILESAGDVVNTTGKRGGTFAYSTATLNAVLTVTPVNDAPVLSAGSPTLFTILEDVTTAFTDRHDHARLLVQSLSRRSFQGDSPDEKSLKAAHQRLGQSV